ncbi:uncharacterized protein LOC126999230 isoform X34 [Eriocheir sinensis]|uniref:uncharacterized protein LOC126999230 isoform X29 n=1 Tax=Eriocheir sinensis TaxID=95602 RepID=UPI0021C95D0C|nr:uncharacterized protein LOC126999230 isoform X29 [Eriocheir sinensis]XP_050717566.1 uncharacterized protein LOC126999230 isoform X30 [Eriocheir sinensis]XP_050717567.1 uncharacterized protein LOC126999230 isoform X31 [Eriocheir sinensis]XP_050717569.1 uncharacterized protein LOC126999230 isoform X32 [Eriocheir sinensis]XP_050717570.1 uncharacterized protein LOC126999230 isoform X33 [Eriocheir sinensis]XP_050717571.1 uncharacterized protein LOC126999230 isoform X34 [Eriocheir sinensis]
MKFIMNWDQPQGPFRRAYTCHRPRHEGKDDKTSGNSRKRNSSTQACVENGCECMCVSGCLTCCRCPSAGCVCSCLVVAPAVAKDIVSRATLCPDLCADCGHCQESNWVSWPGCRQWMQSRGKLQCPGLCAAWQVMQLRFCGHCRESNWVPWPGRRLGTLSAEQLCVLACVQTVDTVRRATGCPGLGADSGCSQEGNFSVLACVQPGK